MRTLLLRSLFLRAATVSAPAPGADALEEVGRALQARARRLIGRSLSIREIDAGSCNGCELEIHALNNAVYDVERFGIRFVASPRHADVLMVTGPVTYNMKVALERTYAATPAPKWVVAVGDCAAGCGVFQPSYAVIGSVDKILPVDLHIWGCPPQPIELLKGLLALLDQATRRRRPVRPAVSEPLADQGPVAVGEAGENGATGARAPSSAP
jgi:Ni,Fe-hydrogenase III small subunit